MLASSRGFFVQCDSFGARRIWILPPLCTYCTMLLSLFQTLLHLIAMLPSSTSLIISV